MGQPGDWCHTSKLLCRQLSPVPPANVTILQEKMNYSSPGSQLSETLHFSDLEGKGRQERWSWSNQRESLKPSGVRRTDPGRREKHRSPLRCQARAVEGSLGTLHPQSQQRHNSHGCKGKPQSVGFSATKTCSQTLPQYQPSC